VRLSIPSETHTPPDHDVAPSVNVTVLPSHQDEAPPPPGTGGRVQPRAAALGGSMRGPLAGRPPKER
jgi:hypothetical protein